MKAGHSISAPDTISYSQVLASLVRSMDKHTSKQIVEIVDKIQLLEENGSPVVQLDNIGEICSNISMSPQSNFISKHHFLCSVFETALRGLSDKLYGERDLADGMLGRMFRLQKSGHDEVKPNQTCLNLVLKAQCSNRNRPRGEMAAFDAQRYILQFVDQYEKGEIEVLPTRVGFNTVLTCWGETSHWKGVQKAEELYRIMQRLSSKGVENVSPDQVTNSLMLSIYSKAEKKNAKNKAVKFFNEINNNDLDTTTCNCMLTRAHHLLEEMEKQRMTDIISYNTVLNACAFSNEDTSEKALSLALQTYRELLVFANPNETSFALAMKACTNLSRNRTEKESHLKMLFNDVCERGFLGKKVVKELTYGVPTAEKRKELLGHTLTDHFETSWKRNI